MPVTIATGDDRTDLARKERATGRKRADMTAVVRVRKDLQRLREKNRRRWEKINDRREDNEIYRLGDPKREAVQFAVQSAEA